jgi:cytochrome c oxidase assembly factor CtaG
VPPLTPSDALTTWQFAPLVTGPLVVLAGCYLVALRRVRRRHAARPWPAARTGAFLAGLAVVAVAAQGSVAV